MNDGKRKEKETRMHINLDINNKISGISKYFSIGAINLNGLVSSIKRLR
jgi:hypothetical protein